MMIRTMSASQSKGSAHAPHENSGPLTYHNGPMLTQNVNLDVLWYGQFGRVQKNTVKNFIKLLNGNGQASIEPQMSKWWKMVMVESVPYKTPYEKAPRIKVNVVKVTDTSFSAGKVLTVDFLPSLIQKATGGKPDTVAVIFASRMVTVVGACTGDCALHEALGKQLNMVVGNPETECPEACAWPLAGASAQGGVKLRPVSGNIGADAMVMHFASALAHTVTNPYNTGFYSGSPAKPNEMASACPHMFGSGAFEGYTSKIRVDPKTDGCFNEHGNQGKKFLLPALWNPRTKSCWTTV